MLALVHEAAVVDDPDPFPRTVLQLLEEIIPVDGVVMYFELERATRTPLRMSTDRPVEFRADLDSLMEELGRLEFPLSSSRGHNGVVWRLSDLIGRRELKRSRFYNELMQPVGDEHYLRAWLLTPPWLSACFEFSRKQQRDFTRRDRRVLEVLLPQLALLRQRASVRRRPAPLQLGLTPRETEVLQLVSVGKTNAEIARALFIAPGTVRSHLENVYEKLGVHTRTAAVARVFNGLAE